MEKMATYIGTKHGNEAAQEWTSRKKETLSEPAYSQAIHDRHAARVKATREQIELRLKSLRAEKTAITSQHAKVDLKPLIVSVIPIYSLSDTINLFCFLFFI
jgi:hypothetical protein